MDLKILISLILICKSVHSETYEVNGLVCDKCPPGTYWIADCKSGQKTECKACPTGKYSETYNIAKECEDCTRDGNCPTGQVFKNTCSTTTNNHCECPDGQFEMYGGGDLRCFEHTKCKEDEIVIKKGTPTEDTKCGPKPTQKPQTPSKSGDEKTPKGQHNPDNVNHVTRPPGNGDARGGSDRKLTVPILLIVCMAIYASYRFYKRYIPRVIHHD